MTAERAKEIADELTRALEESLLETNSSVEHFHYLHAAQSVQELRDYLEEKERKEQT